MTTSEACRTAGAAAVLCDLDLVAPIAKEQESARGEFPGSLPVLTDVALLDLIGERTDPKSFSEEQRVSAHLALASATMESTGRPRVL